MFWIITLSFIVLVALGVIIYAMPSDSPMRAPKRKKSKELKAKAAEEAIERAEAAKDWKGIAERWEKANSNLLADVEKLRMQHKAFEKQVESFKTHEKDMMSKLSQEKSWREKEQVNLDKAKAHEKELKAQIIRTESDLEKEHSLRIRIEAQYQEIKTKFDSQQDEKRTLSTKAASLETTVAQMTKEIKELRQENKELSRKKEDVQWVTKTEYEDVKKELKAKERELAQLKNPSAS